MVLLQGGGLGQGQVISSLPGLPRPLGSLLSPRRCQTLPRVAVLMQTSSFTPRGSWGCQRDGQIMSKTATVLYTHSRAEGCSEVRKVRLRLTRTSLDHTRQGLHRAELTWLVICIHLGNKAANRCCTTNKKTHLSFPCASLPDPLLLYPKVRFSWDELNTIAQTTNLFQKVCALISKKGIIRLTEQLNCPVASSMDLMTFS